MTPVANPTYMADIRFFFRQVDIDHMGPKGIDLSTYDGVKKNAVSIYVHTNGPNADMPPDAAGKWDADRSATFKNWIVKGCPQGTATPPQEGETPEPDQTVERTRKNVMSLSDQELAALKTAFQGLMDRDISAPNSYFVLAGVHGLPEMYCLHHEDRFNPWHRVYMKAFEDELRSIPGCQDVTMPYWDFSTPLPNVLGEEPFAGYTLPKEVTPYPQGYKTSRYDAATIMKNMEVTYDVLGDTATSLNQSLWGAYNLGGYQDFSIQAHDGGHVSIGPTMAEQEIASYDPVFWFFHCNIDRLWLSWQTKVGATTLQGFKSTIQGDTSWLSPPFDVLPPYDTPAEDTIAYGIGYDKLDTVPAEPAPLENKLGNVEATRSFAIRRESPVSVRVKDIERLNIPGSFVVSLLADGEPIAQRAFFQPRAPRACPTCAKQERINIDFRLDQEQLMDRHLSVEIHVPGQEEMGTRFPLAQAGNPTINARLLLDED